MRVTPPYTECEKERGSSTAMLAKRLLHPVPGMLSSSMPVVLFRGAAAATTRSAGPASAACFTTTSSRPKTQYPPRPEPPPDEEITESYLKGSGPGGQKIVCPITPSSFFSFQCQINLLYLISVPSLTSAYCSVLQNKTNSAVQLKHIPTGIVVKCQETRSREQNRKLARQHLAEKIDDLVNGENSRSAVVARIMARKKASALKKSRRKHRTSSDGAADDQEEDGEQDEDRGHDKDDNTNEHRKVDQAP